MTKSTPTTTIFFFSWILVVATAWSLWNLLLSQTTWLIPPLPNKGNNIFFFIGVVDGCFSTTRSPIPTISAPISLPPVQAPISGSTSAGIPFTDMLSSSTMLPPPTCGNCTRLLNVRRNDTASRPITQVLGTDPVTSCQTLTTSCQGITNVSAVIVTWYGPSGLEIGSTFGTGMASEMLHCNLDNMFAIPNGTVIELECLSPGP